MNWNDSYLALFERCLGKYKDGNKDFTTYYSDEDLGFLASIGYKPREFFDFVEDFAEGGDPTPSTAVLVASARRDFFTVVQEGEASKAEPVTGDSIPGKPEAMDGITYLPRILAKARAKLRGELDPDLMFCCGGDRKFLRENGNLHPADFLRRVWAAEDDDQQIADWIKSQKG
ncbi:MAG: DUF5069 domain-containing protein [Akkermansiaceae bacterium]|nr:DUF5069 domain-containing protein [Akkermansiaceae bacterium]